MTAVQSKLTSRNDYPTLIWNSKLYQLDNYPNHQRIIAKSPANSRNCKAIILYAKKNNKKKTEILNQKCQKILEAVLQ